jgi:transposase InsO family protein
MESEIRMRLGWIQLYEKTGDAGLVCRRCGISRPTLRKWIRRYRESGVDGLISQSRKPKNSPNSKVVEEIEGLVLDIRKKRKLGARRIQNELQRLHDLRLSLATIHKILTRHQVKPLVHLRRKTEYKRYQRPIPGERVQMDNSKIAPGLYQYTAIDDCTRYRVMGLYARRNGVNTLLFFDKVIEETPFPIQRIQTDRGREFFAIKVQERLMEYGIKFRPIKPGSPHLNGKVERSQRTDKEEFYSTVDLNNPSLEDELQLWQHQYNWERPHGALNGKTPMDKYFELSPKTPFWDEVEANYDPSQERIREQNYQVDLVLQKLK